MKLSPEHGALLNFATRFGFEAALIFLKGINKPEPTVDDAITALHGAWQKSLQQIVDEPDQTPAPAPPIGSNA